MVPAIHSLPISVVWALLKTYLIINSSIMNYRNMLQTIQNAIVLPTERKKLILFCLPFAGGSATLIYNKWKPKLSRKIILRPIELAGRGNRILEDFYEDVPEAVDDICKQIAKEELLEDHDFAIFGHSMGAYLAYEVIQRLQSEGRKMPVHMFLSGRHAPNVSKNRNYYSLDDETFKKKVLELGATPKAIFDNPEFQRIFIPILRNDFKIAEAPAIRENIVPLHSDMTVLIGEDEDISAEEAEAWQLHTTGECDVKYIKGGHFFILSDEQKVLDIVEGKLKREFMVKELA